MPSSLQEKATVMVTVLGTTKSTIRPNLRLYWVVLIIQFLSLIMTSTATARGSLLQASSLSAVTARGAVGSAARHPMMTQEKDCGVLTVRTAINPRLAFITKSPSSCKILNPMHGGKDDVVSWKNMQRGCLYTVLSIPHGGAAASVQDGDTTDDEDDDDLSDEEPLDDDDDDDEEESEDSDSSSDESSTSDDGDDDDNVIPQQEDGNHDQRQDSSDEYDTESSDTEERKEEEGDGSSSLSSSLRRKSRSKNDKSMKIETYDEPLSLTAIQDLGVTLGVMVLCNKLDLTNAKIIRYARYAFLAYVIVVQLFVLYVRYRAQSINDTTPITITSPLSSLLLSSPATSPSSSSSDMVKNLANQFLSTTSTIVEYDLSQAKSMNSGLLVPMLMLWFLHFKLGQVQPLFFQTANGVKDFVMSPLFQVYVLGRNLERPFRNKKMEDLQNQHQQSESVIDEETDNSSWGGEKTVVEDLHVDDSEKDGGVGVEIDTDSDDDENDEEDDKQVENQRTRVIQKESGEVDVESDGDEEDEEEEDDDDDDESSEGDDYDEYEDDDDDEE